MARGVKEITLLGQIVTSYGKREIPKQDGKSAFVQLLEAVHEIEGLERIRFTSPHPERLRRRSGGGLRPLPKLVESAHIPVQSGSDRVLKLMHRGYTRERFLDIIGKAAARPSPESGSAPISSSAFRARPKRISRKRCRWCARWSSTRPTSSSIRSGATRPPRRCPTRCPQAVREERNQRLLRAVNEIAARQLPEARRPAGADPGGRPEQEEPAR